MAETAADSFWVWKKDDVGEFGTWAEYAYKVVKS
jgi:hypothetical protein